MSEDFAARLAALSRPHLQLLALEQKARLDRLQDERREPIAVVGVGCRFPGAAGPAAYWRLVSSGEDAIREIPADRWDVDAYFDPDPDVVGKMATRWGGFIDGIDRFDSELFGISPREAVRMDPQQRLLLEITWEALEHAGIAADRLRGSRTGVFIGICSGDYFQLSTAGGYDTFDAYLAQGGSNSVASGRLSYVLGLEGPAVSVDTACSSSLMALHLAVRSLRGGECRMALAGGVNAILWPGASIALSRARMMANDGRCKAFDQRANGFVRGEGCGVVVLKRLSDAIADGDRVLAVVRGSAANQDGRSNGLTAPNGPAQTAVIRDALADGGVAPAAVGYVEAHGTGTSLGDPIELHALGAALSPGRDPAAPRAFVGSVKTNFGHLEAAAGIAGIIKTVLALQARQIPPSLHFVTPNPLIDWASIPLAVPTALVPWEAAGRRVAGVSSFGFSGSNAHVILEEAPPAAAAAVEPPRKVHVLPLSARTEPALRALADRYVHALADDPGLAVADVCHTAGAGRARFDHRAAIVTSGRDDLRAQLAALAEGRPDATAFRGQVVGTEAPRIGFLFTGQGAQYTGMGSRLAATEPVFRAALARCAAVLDPILPSPLLETLHATDPADKRIHDTRFTQPAMLALQVALTELWRSWGISPSVVMGHSLGEFAAACAAGVLPVEDALRIVAERARLMQSAPGRGAMAAVFAGEADVRRHLAAHPRVSVGAVNAPDNTVISGPASDVAQVVAALVSAGVEVRPLEISHAFHSQMVEPVLDELERAVARAKMGPPQVALISNVSGTVAGDEIATTAYWRRHLREPVRFADGMAKLMAMGTRLVVEIGPHPALIAMARRYITVEGVQWLASMRRDRDDTEQTADTLAALHAAGVAVDWEAFSGRRGARKVALPNTPFERERFWIETRPAAAAERGGAGLPGRRRDIARGPVVFEGSVSIAELPWLGSHRVGGAILAPAPLFVELARAAGKAGAALSDPDVVDLRIAAPLTVPDEGRREVQTLVEPSSGEGGRTAVEILSRNEGGGWTSHARCELEEAGSRPALAPFDEAAARCRATASVDEHYARLAELGFAFGADFQRLVALARGEEEAVGGVRATTAGARPASLHPAVLDGCLQVLGACLPADTEETFLMVGADRIALYPGDPGERVEVHARIRPAESAGGAERLADVSVVGAGGAPVARLEGVRLRRATALTQARLDVGGPSDWLYHPQWTPVAAATADVLPAPAVLAESLLPSARRLDGEHRFDRYRAVLRELDHLAQLYIARAFRKLGWPGSGAPADLEAWAGTAGIDARYARLLRRLVAILEEAGAAKRLPDADPAGTAADIKTRFPEFEGEVALLGASGSRLDDVLTGRADPLQLLFPGGDTAPVERLTQNSPAARAYNALVAEAVGRLLDALPADRPARIVEIGAGTGGTTAPVLEAIAGKGRAVEYVFTDVSPLFLDRAREKFRAYPFVRFELLDVERDPRSQGFLPQTADIIVAANVVHATRVLRESLAHARAILRPGGALVLLEGTAPKAWVDLTFGLTEGWWRFADTDIRPDYPLVSGDTWRALASRPAWAEVEVLPPRGTPDLLSDSVVVIAAASAVARAPGERWLLVGGTPALSRALAAAATAAGIQARAIALDGADAAALEAGLGRALDEIPADQRPARVVYLEGATEPGPDLGRRVERVAAPALALAREVITRGWTASLWFVTRCATSAAGAADLAGGALWGLGRSMGHEHPELWGGSIDLDGGDDESTARLLIDEIGGERGEPEVVFASGTRQIARLERLQRAVAAPSPPLRSDATYVVTGALGGIGMKVVSWLADLGARHLALLARRAPAAVEAAQLDALRARGCKISLLRADVAVDEQIAAALVKVRAEMPPLAGIFHTAGIYDDAVIRRMDWARLQRVIAVKLHGGFALHRHTQGDRLDHFVLFGSGASILGPVGLANYAAANAALDTLAHFRRAHGLPALCVDWGPWAGTGMAEAVGEGRRVQWNKAGFGPMTPEEALRLLGALMSPDGPAQAAALPIDWRVFRASATGQDPLYERFSRGQPRRGEAGGGDEDANRPGNLAGLSEPERLERLVAYLRVELSRELGIREERLPVGKPISALGFDSLMAVQFRNRVQASLRVPVSLPDLLRGPSVQELAAIVLRALDVSQPAPPAAAGGAAGEETWEEGSV